MCPNDTADNPIRIPLKSKKYPGLYALIDADDLDLVNEYSWSVDRIGGIFYAVTRPERKTMRMHRLIMGFPVGRLVDHRNHDGLDNQRKNLRVCNRRQNAWNRDARRANGAMGFFGVEQRGRRFRPALFVGGKRLCLGTYGSAEEAARARDDAARKYHGEFAALNFPDEEAA